jgi:hypothetical protein
MAFQLTRYCDRCKKEHKEAIEATISIPQVPPPNWAVVTIFREWSAGWPPRQSVEERYLLCYDCKMRVVTALAKANAAKTNS